MKHVLELVGSCSVEGTTPKYMLGFETRADLIRWAIVIDDAISRTAQLKKTRSRRLSKLEEHGYAAAN